MKKRSVQVTQLGLQPKTAFTKSITRISIVSGFIFLVAVFPSSIYNIFESDWNYKQNQASNLKTRRGSLKMSKDVYQGVNIGASPVLIPVDASYLQPIGDRPLVDKLLIIQQT